jgi:hypothetical protein
MLTFRTTTAGRAAFTAITAGNALGLLFGAGGWSEIVQHGKTREKETVLLTGPYEAVILGAFIARLKGKSMIHTLF